MKLTRGGEYGIRGVLYLAHQDNGKVSMLSAIAKAQDVPPRFLAKIFQALAKAGIVRSHRGAKGGFSLARPAAEITIKDVIEAIEGPVYLNVCLVAPGECSRDKICPMHRVWEEAQAKMMGVLGQTNFADLAKAERQAQLTAAS
ncbi:MAG: Rrf2 family transcriptional regulator [candidate division NC10 bacterium]|nr:Rrf2 family transcriptional regulator [candidate division NC10 bacterium]MBI2113919.1 Rrf2 family transcriptional regulator [candidate division NC10 bacterium]MBI2163223.1 Rrf2 family transcriptional regulator [candidate division NC10 bacterium]MBI2457428.1 Rrf2 family transcriptional regulator [candidate division NC10 bacterium]MBI3085772.1 Rrf2 family transcriptional regulator [candidate division NC10 bacterium]